MTTIALGLAEFLCGLDATSIPAIVQAKARACLLNGYGIALGGHSTPYHAVARSAALAQDGVQADGATLLASGERTALGGALVANSALFHGRAQEDACGAAHLGAIVIPLLTALLERRLAPMSNFLPALVAGYEAGGLFEEAFAGRTTPAGFRASTLFGTLAAAAATARLLELPPARTAAALANAASFAGGLLQSFADGTDEWRYQVGLVADIGRRAAALAAAGANAAPHAFEGPQGFTQAFARVPCEAAALLPRLGAHWQTLRVAFKPFPVCAFNQTPVLAALDLRANLQPAALARLRVYMNPYECGYAGMDAVGPFNSISGTLMSIPFCLAAALAHGAPNMARMTNYADPQVRQLIDRIELVPDPQVPTLSCRLEYELADGTRGVYEKPMTAEDYSYDFAQVSALVRRIGGEEGVPAEAYDRLETFVHEVPQAAIEDLLAVFALLPARRRA